MNPQKPLYRISIRQHPRPAPFAGRRLRVLVRKALTFLAPAEADLRILVVDDREMTRWNREFLGRPRTTNVISFPEDDRPCAAPGKPAQTRALAGDILVSAPTCLRQTTGWPGSPEERVLYFIVHGMLHLAGHDHERGSTEARLMRKAETAVYRFALARIRG